MLLLSNPAKAAMRWSEAIASSTDFNCISRARSRSTASLFVQMLMRFNSFLKPRFPAVTVRYSAHNAENANRNFFEKTEYLILNSSKKTGRSICTNIRSA